MNKRYILLILITPVFFAASGQNTKPGYIDSLKLSKENNYWDSVLSTYMPKNTFKWTDTSFRAGTKRIIEITFDLDRQRIISTEVLDTLVKFMKTNFNLKIGVYCHTDQQGSYNHNMTLSNYRALSIVDYLRAKGIDSARLTPKGFGSTQLLIPTEVIIKIKIKGIRDEAYHINRRTEIVILSTDFKK